MEEIDLREQLAASSTALCVSVLVCLPIHSLPLMSTAVCFPLPLLCYHTLSVTLTPLSNALTSRIFCLIPDFLWPLKFISRREPLFGKCTLEPGELPQSMKSHNIVLFNGTN